MPIDAIRNVHANIAIKAGNSWDGSNFGLAFDKFISQFDVHDPNIKKELLEKFSRYRLNGELKQSYSYAFDEWKKAVNNQAQQGTAIAFDIVSLTRIMLGSGNTSALEVGVHLNKPWGVPYISGSSIKGILASFLRKTGTLSLESLDYVNIFGGNYDGKKYSGSVVFNDAWLYPDCDSWFERDIINPHYQKYYSGERFPDGMESPIPVQTLALSSGLSFFVSMQGPDNLLQYLKDVLRQAFYEIGAGAKTAVGYGRFKVVASEEERKKLEESVRKPKVEQNIVTVAVERPSAGAPRDNFQRGKPQPKISTYPMEVVAPIKGQTKKGKWQVCVNIKDKDTLIAVNNSDAVPADKGIDSEIRVKVLSVAMAEYLP
ncbi:type III-B CRISPR module RAMP protein Cmr6 [Fibrobacter sp. UWB12]|uniref:type III-B CRISPR module RAMP protein Cmr6 n=1 Tax=Fibrobacter sp. UWB12 TaxID=1896203 RepID=UPI000919E21C|nr:type III-B CRISPR module RAMP protein Cmr6 [Fibrobacter sp. UWB12]SHL00543.1 CRISPR type III-B/RAMP module RAMP protein Cmr6 [Fibrobacter sp. UWB12]